MPLLLTWRDPNGVARSALPDRSAPSLNQANSGQDIQGLAQRVPMPCGAVRIRAGAGALTIRSCQTVLLKASAGARLVAVEPAARISMVGPLTNGFTGSRTDVTTEPRAGARPARGRHRGDYARYGANSQRLGPWLWQSLSP